MKRIFLLSVFTLLAFITANAQVVEVDNKVDDIIKKNRQFGDTSYTSRMIEFGLTFNQAAFSENWQGGGVNSIAFAGTLSAALERKKNRLNWNNNLLLQYGVLQNQGQTLRKNQDQIFIDSKLGYNLSKTWDMFAAVNFISQFAPGFRFGTDSIGGETSTLISRFMSPGYLTESFGLKYQPVDYFYVRFGLIAFRQTFVLDENLHLTEPNNYGVPIGQTMINQTGSQILSEFNKDIATNMRLKVRYLGFMPYDMPKDMVHRVDLLLTAKVNKFFSTQFGTIWVRDVQQTEGWQYSQTFSFGFLWKVTK